MIDSTLSEESPVDTCSNTSEHVRFRKNIEEGVTQSGGGWRAMSE